MAIGTIVQKFKGLILSWKHITEDVIKYVLWVDDGKWMMPLSDAKFVNHSCDPNCIVNENLDVVTLRAVNLGEELTISYNLIDGADPGLWDERWNFKCLCKAKNCQSFIDKYITGDGKPLLTKLKTKNI